MGSSHSTTAHVQSLLLIEDSEDDVRLTKRALERAHIGNQLSVARDGQEALDMLYASTLGENERYGLILLDLGLPKLDGREVLAKIWADRRLRQVPVIVLTGSEEDEDVARSYKSGAVAFLRKPVQVDQLLRAVGDLPDYRLLIARVEG